MLSCWTSSSGPTRAEASSDAGQNDLPSVRARLSGLEREVLEAGEPEERKAVVRASFRGSRSRRMAARNMRST